MPQRRGGRRISLNRVGALAFAVLSLLLPASALGAYPGSNGRIAYAGRPGASGVFRIFSVFPGMGSPSELAARGYEPAWSASGRRLTYLSGFPGQSLGLQVFRMSADGNNQTRITHDNGIDGSPYFSPNGRWIVYSKDNLPTAGRDNPRRVSLFRIRPDGTGRHMIVTGFVRAPEYSPDGKRILFEGIPKGKPDDSYAIWTIHADGSHLRRLTDPGGQGKDDESPSWSPDGRHLVFLRCDLDSVRGCDVNSDLYVMRSDGSHEQAIRPINELAGPAYSPNGERIALSNVGNGCSDIYTVRKTGTQPRLVTHNCEDLENGGAGGSAGQPSWQPLPAG